MRFSSATYALLSRGSRFALSLPGCHEPASKSTKQAQQDELRQADRGEALLKAAAAQLSDLPAAVDTELRPPVVLLDSRKSADGKDVLATCTANPKAAVDMFNVIKVPAGNSRFRSLGVHSGDILKYYVKEDETVDADSRNAGYSRQLAMDLQRRTSDRRQHAAYRNRLEPARHARPQDRDLAIRQRPASGNSRETESTTKSIAARPIGWEPAPDDQVLSQVMAWLNQWIRQSDPKTDWQRDPLIDTLDANLRGDAELAEANLNRSFSRPRSCRTNPQDSDQDARHIQESIWLRDISRWAHGDGFDDVSRATALFDWTVRNIQLEADEDSKPRRPWQTLLFGRGTAEQRAWVFARLCRQQGLDVVILSLPPAAAADGKSAPKTETAKFWLPALFSEGQLYLFDTRLGLPIPGPDGKGVATLEQVRKDDSLLRKLDIDGAKYPVTAESLKNVEIDLVADPFSLARRASQMEANLSGDDRFILTAKPSELAGRLKSIPGVSSIRLWDFPFQTLSEQLSLGNIGPSSRCIGIRTVRHAARFVEGPHAPLPGSARRGSRR